MNRSRRPRRLGPLTAPNPFIPIPRTSTQGPLPGAFFVSGTLS